MPPIPDGRKLYIRSTHSALNTIFQSAGSIAVKLATIILYKDLTSRGLEFGRDWAMVAHIHDEYQLVCPPENAEFIGERAAEAFRESGRQLGFRVPLDGEFKIGKNWAETH